MIHVTSLRFAKIVFFLIVSISTCFAETNWNKGYYLGLNLANSNLENEDSFNTRTTSKNKRYYITEKDYSFSGKAGYSFQINDKFFLGPEISYTPGNTLTSDDTADGGKEDRVSIQRNLNFGLKTIYVINEQTGGFTAGFGKSFQRLKTFYNDDDPDDNNGGDVQYDDLVGTYFSFGFIAKLKNGYHLEFNQKFNDIDGTVNKIGTVGDRTDHTVTMGRVKSSNISLIKYF